MSRESDCMRAFEYLMGKYVKQAPRIGHLCGFYVRPIAKVKISRRSFITREEHDRILALYKAEPTTFRELAEKVHRSESTVFKIITGIHNLSREKK